MKSPFKKWNTIARIIVAQTLLIWGASSVSAQDDTIPITTNLDPSRIQVVIRTNPEYRKAFSDLAVAALNRAGINVAAQGSKDTIRELDELVLSVKPEPLNDACPGKVLYEPSFALIEEIVVPRVAEVVIKSRTWSSAQPAHLRHTLTRQDLEQDINEFVEKFITNYRLGNPAKATQESATKDRRYEDRRVQRETMRSNAAPSTSILMNLDLTLVNFSLWAGASTDSLMDRAVATASKDGLKLGPVKMEYGPMLSLKLEYEDFDKGCLGKGIYSTQIELVERVRVKRLSDVYIWVTTWSREDTRVSSPPSKEQLEKDSDNLLAEFINAYKSDNRK